MEMLLAAFVVVRLEPHRVAACGTPEAYNDPHHDGGIDPPSLAMVSRSEEP